MTKGTGPTMHTTFDATIPFSKHPLNQTIAMVGNFTFGFFSLGFSTFIFKQKAEGGNAANKCKYFYLLQSINDNYCTLFSSEK